MDVTCLFETVKGADQAIIRLMNIDKLCDEGLLFLTAREYEEAVGRCRDICHEDGVHLEINYKGLQ